MFLGIFTGFLGTHSSRGIFQRGTFPISLIDITTRKMYLVIQSDFFIPKRWRSPTTIEKGHVFTIPKRSRSQNCQVCIFSGLSIFTTFFHPLTFSCRLDFSSHCRAWTSDCTQRFQNDMNARNSSIFCIPYMHVNM